MGWGHHPVTFNQWGGMGPGAQSLLHTALARATADLGGWPKTQRILELRQALAMTLCREVARQLGARCRVLDLIQE